MFGTSGGVLRTWARNLQPEVYPLVGIMGGACGLASWFGLRHLFTNPDVQISKIERKQTIRNNHEEGKKWVKHHKTMRTMGPRYVVYEKDESKN